MRASFAEGCAWRAVYVYLANGRKIAHLGVDPTGDRGPALFGSLAGRSFRCRLPHAHWRYRAPLWHRALAQVSGRFYHSLDGRYGALRPGVVGRLLARLRGKAEG